MWSKSARVLAGLAAALMLSACTAAPKKEAQLLEGIQEPQQMTQKTEELAVSNLTVNGQSALSIKYLDQLSLKWEGETGVITELNVTRKNRAVKAGEVLAVFEVEVSQAKLKELKIQLDRQETNYSSGKQRRKEAINEAKADLEGLTSHRLTIAQQELEKLQADYDRYVYNTRKTIDSLEAQIEELENAKLETTLVAPVDGMVTWVSGSTVGDVIKTGTVMFKMYGYGRYELTSTASDLRYNMEVFLRADKNNNDYKGRVVCVDSLLPEDLRSGKAVILLDADSGATGEKLEYLSKSNSQNLRYVAREVREVPLVGGKFLKRDGGGEYVYILNGTVPVKRYVKLAPGETSSRWVLAGLTPGQVLVQN